MKPEPRPLRIDPRDVWRTFRARLVVLFPEVRNGMKHYPHHIGDFDRATRHLTRIERSVYRDLIELYYDTESQLSLDKEPLCRKIIARSNEESTAVEQVLNEFFTKTPTGWFHERCEEEISKYHANNSQKAQAGKASAAAKAQKRQQALNGISTDVQRTFNGTSTNHQPSTINQSTKEEAKASLRAAKKCPASFSVTEVMSTWAAENVPLVDQTLETEKMRDHTFAAARVDWVGTWKNWLRKAQEQAEQRRPKPGKSPPVSFNQLDREAGMRRWEEQTGRVHPDRKTGGIVIDVGGNQLEIGP